MNQYAVLYTVIRFSQMLFHSKHVLLIITRSARSAGDREQELLSP